MLIFIKLLTYIYIYIYIYMYIGNVYFLAVMYLVQY